MTQVTKINLFAMEEHQQNFMFLGHEKLQPGSARLPMYAL
jgi:hypothetical protein